MIKAAQRIKELQYSRSVLRSILDSTTDGILVLRRDGSIANFNRAFVRMWGIPESLLVARDDAEARKFVLGQLANPDDFAGGVAAHMSRPSAELSDIIRFKDGRVIERHIAPHRLDGEIVGSVITFTDVTQLEQKKSRIEEKDLAIRRAYSHIIGTVTGNCLVLLSMDEIKSHLGTPLTPEHLLLTGKDLADARGAMREALCKYVPRPERLGRFIVAVGEALANALEHAGSGMYRAYLADHTLQVVVRDHGPGINFARPPRSVRLSWLPTPPTPLGLGFAIMLDGADRVLLSTERGNTFVILETELHP